jgi:hypothetical protein
MPENGVPLLSSVSDLALAGLGLASPPEGVALQASERAVIIELDGVGWYTFEGSRSSVPNITASRNGTCCLTAYPPITNVGTAFAVTGAPPAENGIRGRPDHMLQRETVFQIAGDAGMDASWIDSDIGFLDAEMENVPDSDGDGTSDDEILDMTLRRIGDGDDLIMAHFHSYDDTAHEDGALGPNATATLRALDGYVGRIARSAASDGKPTLLVLFSDHGSPAVGRHGKFRSEDMYSMLSWEVLNGGSAEGTALTVSLDGAVKANLSMAIIETMPHVEGQYPLRSSRANLTNSYQGVPLEDLIALTGVDGTPSSVRLVSSDGLSAAIDPAWIADRRVIMAYAKDGAPMVEEGPLRLIVPQEVAGEFNAQYCVKYLVRLEVRS